jgi:hypothetical protein
MGNSGLEARIPTNIALAVHECRSLQRSGVIHSCNGRGLT